MTHRHDDDEPIPRDLPAARWFRDWLPLIALVTSGLLWGMKLENDVGGIVRRQEALDQRLARVEAQVAMGILPRADEPISALTERVARIEQQVESHD